MRHNGHEITRTICAVVAVVAVGWIAFEYHKSAGDLAELRKDAIVESNSLAAVSVNAAALSDNLAVLAGELRDPENGIPPVLAAINGDHGLKKILINVDNLTAQLAEVGKVVADGSLKEQAEVQKASELTVTALGDAGLLIKSTDGKINGSGGVLDGIVSDLHSLDGSIKSLTDFTTSATKLSNIGQLGLQDIHSILSDPNIKTAAEQLADTTVHLDQISLEAARAVGYIEDDLNPKKKLPLWKRIIMIF